MANSASLKNLRPWVKGQSGNPGGVPQLPPELKAIKSLTQIEITKLISKFARMSPSQMFVAMKDPNNSIIELTICSIFQQSLEKGDFTRLSFLLDRCVGKVRDVVEDDESLDERQELQKLSMKELLTLVKDNLPEET